jgi:hypothetical protein
VLAERHAILFEEAARALSGGFTPGGCGRSRPGGAALASHQRLDET